MDNTFVRLLKRKIESGEISIEEIPNELAEQLDD